MKVGPQPQSDICVSNNWQITHLSVPNTHGTSCGWFTHVQPSTSYSPKGLACLFRLAVIKAGSMNQQRQRPNPSNSSPCKQTV